MNRSTLLAGVATVSLLCAVPALAQTPQGGPQEKGTAPQEKGTPMQRDPGSASGGEQRAQQRPDAGQPGKTTRGEQGEKESKGTAQSEPSHPRGKVGAEQAPKEKTPKAGAERATDSKDGRAGTAEKKADSKDRATGKSDAEKAAESNDKAKSKSSAEKEPTSKGAVKGAEKTRPESDKKTRPESDKQGADRGKGAQDKSGPSTAGDTSKTGSGSRAQLSQDQRVSLQQTITKERNFNRVTKVNFSVHVGTRVPRSVRLAVLPASVVTIVPAYRGYRYFAVNDDICIVDPGTYEIVEVITISGQTASHGDATLVLTERERDILFREVDMSNASTLGLGVLTVGADVPRGARVHVFSDTIVEEIPKLRNYKYFTAENRLIVTDERGSKVQLVIENRH